MDANDGTERKEAEETRLPMPFNTITATNLKIAQLWPRCLCCIVVFLLCTTKYLYGTSGYAVDTLYFRSNHTLQHQGLDCPTYTVWTFRARFISLVTEGTYKTYSMESHPPFSNGPLRLAFMRPKFECRTFRSDHVEVPTSFHGYSIGLTIQLYFFVHRRSFET